MSKKALLNSNNEMLGRGQTVGIASVLYLQWQLQKTWGCRGRFPSARVYFHALTSLPRRSGWPWPLLLRSTCAAVGQVDPWAQAPRHSPIPRVLAQGWKCPWCLPCKNKGSYPASFENNGKTPRAFSGSAIGPNSRIRALFCTVTKIVTSALPLCCLS